MPQQLLDSEEQLRLVFKTAINAVVTMNADGLITGWNPKAEAVFGWGADEAIGRPVADLIIPERYRDAHWRGLKHYLETGEGPVLGKVIEIAAIRRDGTEVPVELSISPAAHTESGLMFVAFLHDITERHAAEASRREDAERIAELERAKSLILSVASHELRGPISLLNGYLEMIGEGGFGEINADLGNVLGILRVRVKQMELLVSRMLEAARLDDPARKLRLENADLVEMARRGINEIRQVSSAEQEISLAEAGPVVIQVDAAKVQTAINNLLENAVKYSPKHTPVTCTVARQDGRATVVVSDQGIGMEPGQAQQKLFSRFGRLDSAASAGISGTGLGLYISREIARLHGGDITAESELGKGSTFTLSIPAP
jgi:PAS domain S-box-containing protein